MLIYITILSLVTAIFFAAGAYIFSVGSKTPLGSGSGTLGVIVAGAVLIGVSLAMAVILIVLSLIYVVYIL